MVIIKTKVLFVDFWEGFDYKKSFFWIFLSKNFDIIIDSNPEVIIYSCYGIKHFNYDCKKVFFTPEYIVPDFNECDYAIGFDHLDFGERYLRWPNYFYYKDSVKLAEEKHRFTCQEIGNKNKFCNFIYSNKETPFRNNFFSELSKYKFIDSSGKALNNTGLIIENKLLYQKGFRFTIAMENFSAPGYTTEKILDAFAARTVPIYWGNPMIHLDFNPKSFINLHNYDNIYQAIDWIIKVDSEDDLFMSYLKEPAFVEGNYKPNNEILFNFFERIILDKDNQKTSKNFYQINSMNAKRRGYKINILFKIYEKISRLIKR